MMKNVLIYLINLISITSFAQTKEHIDSLRSDISRTLSNYELCLYRNLVDVGEVDSIWFYSRNNELQYIIKQKYRGSTHNAEQYVFTELFFDKGKVIFRRAWGYMDENNRTNTNNTLIKVSESIRSYYKYNGESILCHDMREAEGPYAQRDSLLNTVPLKSKSGWLDCLDRVDKIIEKDYISIYNNYCLNKE